MSQPATKKRKTGASVITGPKITDERFANIQSDPRYRLPGRKERVKVDKRFARAFEDEDFSRKAKVDRYGRPVKADAEKERLKRKYVFEDDESSEADDDEEVQAELERVSNNRDVLREGKDVSSGEDESSSDGSDEDEDLDEAVDSIRPEVQDQDVPLGEVSSQIAVVNLDWDNIRAEDLMAVFQSFLPATGRLLRIAVYPSEFGKERMEREEMEGPPKEIFAKNENDESESDEEEADDDEIKESIIKPDDGSEFDSTALRQYQLERLRYFYAIMTFSDSATAKTVYDAVDGTEYLSTANFFDLRFVPEGTDFSENNPREECERIPPGYKPNEFVTDALQHSKVRLTWDADDVTRKEAQARAFRLGRNDINEDDLKAYLATDSESEDEQGQMATNGDTTATTALSKKETERKRMRALLGLAAEPAKRNKDKKAMPLGNVQVTFSLGLSGPADEAGQSSDEQGTTSKSKKKHRSVFENSPEPEETTMEKYVRKERERKQRRREKTKANRADADGDAEPRHQKRQAAADEATTSDQDQDLGFDDPFFAEPSHDAKSASKQRKAERLQRRAEREAEEAASAQERAKLELLMADDDVDDGTTNGTGKQGHTVKHFDMNEIEKAEKAVAKMNKKKGAKKHKNKKDGGVDHEAVLAADDFKVDTADPRFARLYQNPEFAIDPTNSRFKDTKGMRTLLEETRKRKEKNENAGTTERSERRNKKKDGARNGSNTEIMGLVEKIKKRNK